MKKVIALGAVLCLLVAVLSASQFASAERTYPDVTGDYTVKCSIKSMDMDSVLITRDRTAELTITTQNDGVISVASITIGAGDPIALLGYVGSGTRPRISLYGIDDIAEPGVLDGNLLVINGVVRLNKDGSVKRLQGSLQGINNAATVYQLFGSGKAKPVPPD